MDLLDLFVKIGVEDNASKETSAIGESIKTTISGAAKVAGAAVAAASAGIVALGTSAVKSYADFEQLTGGVETMFKESGDKVMEYAENAYKTAGISANEYMETVTGFSASLISSLGGDTGAAADLANQALVDMSDNAAKFGSDFTSIQNAYNGFAKANFQMLDNLKLGYGGSKTEMERLLEDAEKIKAAQGEVAEYSVDSYADIIEAIHVVQTEMGITGTTEKEAAATISGSIGMVSSAWENLITAIGGGGDLDAALTSLQESALAVFNNLLPAIETVLQNLPAMVEGLTPMIVELVPFIVSEVIPEVVNAGITLVGSLSAALIEAAPQLFDAAVQIATTLYEQFKGAIVSRFPEAAGIFTEIETTVSEWANKIWEIIQGFVEVIQEFWNQHGEQIVEAIRTAWEDIKTIIDFALAAIKDVIDIFMAVLNGDWSAAWEGIKKLASDIWNGILAAISGVFNAINAAWVLFFSTFENVAKDGWNKLKEWFSNMGETIKETIMGVVEKAKNWGTDLIDNFVGGIKEKWNALKESVMDIAETVADFIGFSEPERGPLSNFHTYGPDMMDLYAKGIKDNLYKVEDALNGVPTLTSNGGGVIHNYIEIGGQPLLDFVNEGLGAAL